MTSPDEQTLPLADGHTIPTLGLGVWQIPDGPGCVDAVRWALELGYRHVDTAQAYGNEESVGQALLDSGVSRDEVFITTKFHPTASDPVAEVERSLERLGTDYVDLYIVHWPRRGPTWMWSGMERSREAGFARSIGVSNYSVAELDQVLEVADIPPVVNQVQLSPFEYRQALIAAATGSGILIEAYSPLGTGRHLTSEPVVRMAERLERTPAQVLLRWGVQRGLVVLPKSVNRDRIAENARIFDFTLSEPDLKALDDLDSTGHTPHARESKWW